MSKAALNMGASLVHNELVKEGGRVIQIHPGHMKSFMHGEFNPNAPLSTDESACKIIKVIDNQVELLPEGEPAYLDLYGGKLIW